MATSWAKTFVNYTGLAVRRLKDIPREDGTPPHKANIGVALTWDKKPRVYTLDLIASYLSGYNVDMNSSVPGSSKVQAATVANLRLGCEYKDWMEFSLYIYNLLHDKHREFRGALDLSTRVVAKLGLKF
jgi:hypothetical protein